MDNPLLKKEEKAERAKMQQITEAKIIGAINRTFGNDDGIITLRWLMNLCDWNQATVCQDPKSQEINLVQTTFIATRQGVYREVRALIKADILKQVEFEEEQTNEGEKS